MGGRPTLHLLRPYAFQTAPKKSDLYSRFYTVARIACSRSGSLNQSRLSTPVPGRKLYSSTTQLSVGQPSATDTQPCPDGPSFRKTVLKETDDQKAFKNQRYQRIRKLKESDALRYPRFRYEGDPAPMSIPEFREKYKNLAENARDNTDVVRLQGRVMSVRKSSSKLAFIDIQSEFKKVQAMVSFSVLAKSGVAREDFTKFLSPLLRGDFVTLAGSPIRTATGELTLNATMLPTLLTPSLTPIPEKLINDETMVQNRSLDLLVHTRSAELLRFRSDLIWWMRQFFHRRKYMEVQTPILADYAGGATARPFITSATEFPSKELALRIAPELWLKRLVVGGFDRIFEIGPSFRNEGLDGTHNPEFTMCEFYMAYINLTGLMNFTSSMMRDLAKHCASAIKQEYQTLNIVDQEYFSEDFTKIQFIPGLEEKLGFQIPNLEDPDALDRLTVLLANNHIRVETGMSLAKLLDKLAAKLLEPVSSTRPLFITHHPACMSPLAKSFICNETQQLVSARAELFVKGHEIANMYEEENDPFTQRRKFEAQVRARNAGDQEAVEGRVKVDESFIQALEQGLPPTGGWGCGVDRLVMLFSGATKISDTLSFGNLRNVISVPKKLKD